MTILKGDFNAKIGANNTGYEEVMGRQGLGTMNKNSDMSADLCALKRLIIGGCVFPHRRTHKATWISPDHRTENHADRPYLHKTEIQEIDAGHKRGADHHLLLARKKMKLKKREIKREQDTKWKVDVLKDREVTETFRLTIINKYVALQDLFEEENMDINTQWQHIKETWTSTCKEILGKKKCQHKEWISADTISKVQVRTEKKGVINNSRTRAAKAAARKQ